MVKAKSKALVLSTEEIKKGIDKACANAYDLAQAAFLTDGQDMKAVARALFILFIEEYGKVGWMYWALSLAPDDREGWGRFWKGFTDHSVKNEVGRLMALDLLNKGLLPLRSAHFGFRFPFFALRPASLDRLKQAMFYVDFDDSKRRFIGPLDWLGGSQMDNSDFFEQLRRLIRYIAYNRKNHVFDLRVMTAFRNLNYQARDVNHWAALIRLFYAAVLNHPTGMVEERSVEDVIHELKSEHGMDPDPLVEQLSNIGDEFRQSS